MSMIAELRRSVSLLTLFRNVSDRRCLVGYSETKKTLFFNSASGYGLCKSLYGNSSRSPGKGFLGVRPFEFDIPMKTSFANWIGGLAKNTMRYAEKAAYHTFG
jgi:hypothetical protein